MTPFVRFLTARWIHLLMANYEVEPAILEPRIPRGTELDLFEGRCLVSVVGFRFLDTRVLGLAIPFHRDFEEVNLRFYVKRVLGDEVRRGVVFVKEIVPKRAIAWIANALYNEKYRALSMSHEDRIGRVPAEIGYRWKHRGRWEGIAATLEGEPLLPDADSEEAFITEHYWGYTAQRDGGTLEYRVEHPPWRKWGTRNVTLDCDVTALYGPEFAPYLAATPASCFVAEGSRVEVGRGQRI
jgi:uncharacterized protein